MFPSETKGGVNRPRGSKELRARSLQFRNTDTVQGKVITRVSSYRLENEEDGGV